MITVLTWYLAISAVGLLALPLSLRLFSALPDRGFSLSRPLGWLVWGFAFWLLGSLGVIGNNAGGLLLSLLLVIALSAWAVRSMRRDDLAAWWQHQRGFVLVHELLFLLAFAGYAVIRAYNPEAIGTEKPMELAFINAILNSPTIPPHDPWLAGYAISYYHLGYILVSMLAMVTSTSGAVAFNLGLVLAFSLSASSAYGLVHNLLSLRRIKQPLASSRFSWPNLAALLGPVFLLLVGNLEALLHMLHGAGWFWGKDAGGNPVSGFWTWLNILDLRDAPMEPLSWIPTRFWWWWRASRVVSDFNYAGGYLEIIDEFPAFSYVLGDLHPHVLSMPFLLLVAGLALQVFLQRAPVSLPGTRRSFDLRSLLWGGALLASAGIALALRGAASANDRLVFLGVAAFIAGLSSLFIYQEPLLTHGWRAFIQPGLGRHMLGKELYLDPLTFAMAVVIIGAVPFLNTWDFPVALALFGLAYALGKALTPETEQQENASLQRRVWSVVSDAGVLGVFVTLAGVLLYLPFYLGFASQAGGPLPNLIFPTRGAHLWVMFGTLFIPLLIFLFYLISQYQPDLRVGIASASGLTLALWLGSLLLGLAILYLPTRDLFLSSLAAPDAWSVIRESLSRRAQYAGGLLTLVLLLGLALSLVYVALHKNTENLRQAKPADPTDTFVLLLVFLGVLLLVGVEFVYLRDQFPSRMNTVFKFYFQAWQLLALATAYGAAVLWDELRGKAAIVFGAVLSLVIVVGLLYPVLGIWSKANGFQSDKPTLDSTAYRPAEELSAANWLNQAPAGVIAEAVSPTGGSYTDYARMATLSGQPAVLGWMGHEGQWRGGGAEMGSRQPDIARLYCSRTWEEAQTVIAQYNIQYIVVGNLERQTYKPETLNCPSGIQVSKFQRNLKVAFESESITIYTVPAP